MACLECERVRRYMSADPEMYRGEDHRCSAHREISSLSEDKSRLDWLESVRSKINQIEGPACFPSDEWGIFGDDGDYSFVGGQGKTIRDAIDNARKNNEKKL